ncbi:OLC1v1022058C1 [Oldenlandia corymbosa var. corymbosa]|uniref:OLC1v1022058C1 n=1 Tax=Oldenlandia corymbosa var. corymbosa TaxID=529605 RepID=A0AAV1C0R7_OLDCO|nr:OLC1v1022058C1 [Oldenlandia corymbosa var. corymbosa]
MEFQISSWNFISLFFFFFATAFFTIVKQWKKNSKKSNVSCRRKSLPPGPQKLPFIGSLHLMGTLPHQNLAKLANKYGPLMHIQLGEISAIVVSSPQMAKEITKTHDLAFASRPKLLAFEIVCYGSKDIAFTPYGDYWRQMRKICIIELLSAKNVRSFDKIRQDVGSKMVEEIRSLAGETVNLAEQIFSYQSSMVSRAAFGKVSRRQQLEFVGLMKEVASLGGGFDIADIFPSYKFLHSLTGMKSKLLTVHQKMDLIFEDIIKEHIQNRGHSDDEEDLVDALLRVKEDGDLQVPITNDAIKAVIFDMFAAGIETSSTAFEWVMSELIKNPNVMAKAQHEVRQALKGKGKITDADILELKYLKLVIKETLRLHPPFPLLLPRESREEREIDGYTIPVKTKVMINVWAMGKNPEYWPNPESFEPERFEDNGIDFYGNHFEYLPFGAGRRICPGMSFGLANVELPVALMLYHFDWKLPDGNCPEDLDMLENRGITAPRKNNLHLVPVPV